MKINWSFVWCKIQKNSRFVCFFVKFFCWFRFFRFFFGFFFVIFVNFVFFALAHRWSSAQRYNEKKKKEKKPKKAPGGEATTGIANWDSPGNRCKTNRKPCILQAQTSENVCFSAHWQVFQNPHIWGKLEEHMIKFSKCMYVTQFGRSFVNILRILVFGEIWKNLW